MSFDIEPDGNIHGECAAEIRDLGAQLAAAKTESERNFLAADKWQDQALSLQEQLHTAEVERDVAKAEADSHKKAWVERVDMCISFQDKLRTAEADLVLSQQLVKEICDEWNEDCDPTCDSYGHQETCKSVNIAQAKRALKEQLRTVEADAAGLRAALQNWLDATPVMANGKFHPVNDTQAIRAQEALSSHPAGDELLAELEVKTAALKSAFILIHSTCCTGQECLEVCNELSSVLDRTDRDRLLKERRRE